MLQRAVIAVTLAGVVLLGAGQAAAQGYPNKPIKVVVGFAAGGAADVIARIITPVLSRNLGQNVIIENRPGADGIIGAEAVARAAPDGYTLLLTPSGHAINASLYRRVPYDTLGDFAPVVLIGDVPSFVTVNPAVPAQSLVELIAFAKTKKADLNYASAASSIQLMTDLMSMMAGIHMTRVAYKGGAPAVTAVIANDVQVFLGSVPTVLPHIKSGKLRVLAVTTPARTRLAPEVPTVAEAGIPGYDATTWFGVLAPKGTPADVVARLNAEIAKVLADEEVLKRLRDLGLEPAPASPQAFGEFIRSEVVKWEKVVKATGAQID